MREPRGAVHPDYAAACAMAAKNQMVHDGSGATVEVAEIHEIEM